MKKFTTLLAGAAILTLAGSSWAVPYASNDTSDFGHDRYAGQVASGEAVFVIKPGLNANATNDFSYTNDTFGRSFAGLKERNSHRRHDGADPSLHDDSNRNYSHKTNHGRDTDHGGDAAPVPEPGTMVLLGFGLLGLAIYGKFRSNKMEAC